MKKEKRKQTTIKEVIVYILQQAFANSVGSWGAFIVDEDGNFSKTLKFTYYAFYPAHLLILGILKYLL